jgi:ABC-type cobalamin/Fe3+-siderophores transport system ATPase subunit
VPQIEEVQFVWWGPFRPDTVPLAVDGINVATGPNGAGKTAFLDGIKLLLGTDQLKAKPADYIYVSGAAANTDGEAEDEGEPAHRAQHALLRAVFANPERGGVQGRLFSDAGRGCERAEYVTAICEVTRDKRRYVLMPDRITWGEQDRDLEADLDRLRAIPSGHWLGPRQWQGLMQRAGVSRSLVQLMSMGQGETDKAIHGTPEQLLRRALELTGRQEIIDDFRETKKDLDAARLAHHQAFERFEGEQHRLEVLEARVQRHLEFQEARSRLQRINQLELPVARYRAANMRLDALRGEREGMQRNIENLKAGIATLEEQIPGLERSLDEHDSEATGLRDQAEAARRGLSDAAVSRGALDTEHTHLGVAAQTAAAHHDGSFDEAFVEAAQTQANATAAGAERVREELAAARHDVDALAAGRPILPPGLDSFGEQLRDHGIACELIAEHLHAEQPAATEAALHDGVWALVVAAADFDAAIALAAEHGHRLPIVRAGEGSPGGALARTSGMPAAGAYLAEISLPVDEIPGVSADGVVRGNHWAALRRPESPILGEQARRRALQAVEQHVNVLLGELHAAESKRDAARERAEALRAGLRAAQRLPTLVQELAAAHIEHEQADALVRELQIQLSEHDKTRGRLGAELGALHSRRGNDGRQLEQSVRRLATYDQEVADAEAAIESLTTEQRAIDDVPSEEALEHERERLGKELDDEVRYPHEVRSEMILVECEDHQRRVEEIRGLLEGRERDLRDVTEEVERARERYTQHIRQIVGLVGQRFSELCERAGMEGKLQLMPSSEIEGELGLELKVAHVRGERMLSARHPHHSGGQRVKMAILLLLASMGVEGATDLLLMDEHSAHLDSRNIDHVADLMNQLKGHVQFILAMPSHAEALRLAWCDHQLAFYLRSGQELYAPPIRLLTHLPDDGEAKYLQRMGQLPLAN